MLKSEQNVGLLTYPHSFTSKSCRKIRLQRCPPTLRDLSRIPENFNSSSLAAAHLVVFVWHPFSFLAFAKDISNFSYFSMNCNLNSSPGWCKLGEAFWYLVCIIYPLARPSMLFWGRKFWGSNFFLAAWGPNQPTGPRSGIMIPTPPCSGGSLLPWGAQVWALSMRT